MARLRPIRHGRRRTRDELNQALHELRRPLTALMLIEESAAAASGTAAGTTSAPVRLALLEMAAAATSDLDRVINGGPQLPPPGRIACRELVLSAIERWRAIAVPAGEISVSWTAGDAWVSGDPGRFAQAIDNLLANAIEHGSPPVFVKAARKGTLMRLTVMDAGRPARGASGPEPARDSRRGARDPRRGHGMRVVSAVAAELGGRFVFCPGAQGSVAALELPLAVPEPALAPEPVAGRAGCPDEPVRLRPLPSVAAIAPGPA